MTGIYRSNFADLGFFVTEVQFNSDQTFLYNYSGDLTNWNLNGKYKIVDKTLYLKFDDEKPDSVKMVWETELDSIIDYFQVVTTLYELKKENRIDYHLKYKIKSNHKLFPYHVQTGKIVKKGTFHSLKRKYLIFGPKTYNKRFYLEKVK